MGKKHKKKHEKKRNKYFSHVEDIDCLEQRTGQIHIKTDPLLNQSQRRDQHSIPAQMLLTADENPGFFFGTVNQTKARDYIGMSQGTEGNIAVIGGNGSGKSAGIVKPTLRSWQGPICATDIKGELSEFYKDLYLQGFVARPYIVFDPMDAESPSYDPFWQLAQGSDDDLISSIFEIARAIIPVSSDDIQPFWTETEQGVLAAALLYYFKIGLSFSEAICEITASTFSSLCDTLVQSADFSVKMLLGEAGCLKGETRATIDRGLRNKLMLFAADPYISHAFRGKRELANCFNWDHLEEYNIFLRIPADRIEQWGGAINLIYTQLIHHLERRPERYSLAGRDSPQILLIMDEFARFGKLEAIPAAMATLRSKNVNICLIIQSVAQLDKIYGEHDRRIILDNCPYQAILRANDADTQKHLCGLIGSCIRRQHSVSANVDRSMDITGYSKNISEIREPQVFPHELSALEDILLLTPRGFFRVDKLRLAGNPAFLSSPHVQSASGSALPLASLDDPVTFYENNFKMNRGAERMSIHKRVQNADAHIEHYKHEQRLEQKMAREERQRRNQRRNYIIGELVTEFFPEVSDFEPGTREQNEVQFRPLRAFLAELASDRGLVQELKDRASHRAVQAELPERSDLPQGAGV